MSWKDLNLYSYTDSHSTKEWGWEFLRRNPEYIKDWEGKLSSFKAIPKQHILLPMLLAADVSQYSNDDITNYKPLNLTDPTIKDTFVIPSDSFISWGIRYYQDPDTCKLIEANLSSSVMLHIGNTEGMETLDRVSVDHRDHTLITTIDLTMPLNAQLDIIKATAKKIQDEIRENEPEKIFVRAKKVSIDDNIIWKDYIRCLDALKAGVSRKIAAPIILGYSIDPSPEERWDEILKQANYMVSQGFRPLMG